jgi:ribosomal protein L16 Arg81 hydroxylase
MSVGASRLEWLLDPFDSKRFADEYWERKPLLVTWNNQSHYSELFSLVDFDELLTRRALCSSRIRIVGGEINPPPASQDDVFTRAHAVEALFSDFRHGATLVAQSIHEQCLPLMEFCRALASTFSATFQINAYLTPARSRGLNPHYDTHDVFVLQIFGKKRWRLYSEGVRMPLGGQVYSGEFSQTPEPLQIFEISPGDLIYIPRG